MAVLCVYVPKDSKKNLETGIDHGIWGWKGPTIELAQKESGWPGIGVGDFLLLGHLGVGRKEKDLDDFTVGRVIVARVVGALFADMAEVWPDDVYPYRVRFTVIDAFDQVKGPEIGQGAMEALRRSCIIRGAPFQDVSGLAVDRLAGTVDELGTPIPDVTPPDTTDSMPDLPDDLDYSARVMLRREQRKLRKAKFKGAHELACALCGRLLPERLVHAAHVKKRSVSSYPERCDPSNIMGACVLGCDSLFEFGYVYVAADGKIHTSHHASGLPDLAEAAAALEDRACTAFSDDSADYFAWQRVNVAGVSD